MASHHEIEVGYWDIRGLAAPLRMMCVYAGVPHKFTEFKVVIKEDGSFDASGWFKERKPKLLEQNALINLPYVVDGDRVITQSNACLLYLGRRLGFDKVDEDTLVKIEQALFQIFDLRNDAVDTYYCSKDEFPKKKTSYNEKNIPTTYDKLENFLKQNKTTFIATNDKPSSADFHIFEILDQNELWAKFCGIPSFFDHNKEGTEEKRWPNLKTYYEHFKALPQLQAYFTSPHATLPVNNTMAQFK